LTFSTPGNAPLPPPRRENKEEEEERRRKKKKKKKKVAGEERHGTAGAGGREGGSLPGKCASAIGLLPQPTVTRPPHDTTKTQGIHARVT
jgi:hypothetical protein